MDFREKINEHILEYTDSTHTYLCDGELVPSITQVMKLKFGGMYDGVPMANVEKAREHGSAVHAAIEAWCETGEVSEFQEVKNFQFLIKKYGFQVLKNEVPVILFADGIPIAAGRLDLVVSENRGGVELMGLADIKCTATLHKEYLAYQLNLYRIAYQQCYNEQIAFLKGVHLKGEKIRKYVEIPINESLAWDLIEEYINE